ncbi:acyl-CoA thioesterase [Salinibacterium sp. SYSU T00001]|uniref:acyl-CoA thioesterase n=1 Tax=Homoserinimonas sedimenticola TaxID=2986805 RepID=UPI002236AE25|nr:thioesterase family protein [Salinibacterium sedimenticola]MCW4386075.1 acyl-CoA thioesterase [Salinibacterium sedimenticola]
MPEAKVAIRWGDMDSYGHVNNVFFVRYLEDTRFAIFSPPLGDAAAEGVDPGLSVFDLFPEGSNGLVAGHRIEYRAPLNYRAEPLTVRLWVTRVGGSSVDLGYELGEADGSTVYAVASTTLVMVDTATGRPSPISDDLRATFSQWLGEPVPFR